MTKKILYEVEELCNKIQYQGEDMEFYSTGNDETYLKENGVDSFIDLSRSSGADDLFFAQDITIEDAFVEIDEPIGPPIDNVLTIKGDTNRFDGIEITAYLDDGLGHTASNTGCAAFDAYSIDIDVSELPEGTYQVTVTDENGNSDTSSIYLPGNT